MVTKWCINVEVHNNMAKIGSWFGTWSEYLRCYLWIEISHIDYTTYSQLNERERLIDIWEIKKLTSICANSSIQALFLCCVKILSLVESGEGWRNNGSSQNTLLLGYAPPRNVINLSPLRFLLVPCNKCYFKRVLVM